MQNSSSSQPWPNNLKNVATCPLCGNKFKRFEARTIEEHGNSQLFFSTAKNASIHY